MPEPFIGELLDLPDQVFQGDFVLNLSAGMTDEHAARTLAVYVEKIDGWKPTPSAPKRSR